MPHIEEATAKAEGALASEKARAVVHDLGNLIQVAMSALNIISRSPSVAGIRALQPVVEHAQMSLERAGELVHQSMGASIDPDALVQQLDLGECLSSFLPILRGACAPKVTLELDAPSLPKIYCNPLDFQNAILNLVVNAKDAMQQGGLITIGAGIAEGPETGEIEIVVADTGLGMTPEIAARAFVLSYTTKPHGNGVGLSTVKQFAEGLGGRAYFESRPGVGTKVFIRLPIF